MGKSNLQRYLIVIMDELGDNENRFIAEDVSTVIQECLEGILGGSTYQTSKTDAWTNQVVEACLGKLAALEKAFKYSVTCTLMQKNRSGITCGQQLLVGPEHRRKLHSSMGE